MALTKISDLGGQVILGDYTDETILPAIADGTAKAGNAVYINAAGQAVQTDVDVADFFTGYLLPHYKVDVDTAITAALPCSVVIPKSGHLYGVFINDPALSHSGVPLIFTTTAGSLGKITDVEATKDAYTYSITSGDSVGIIIWK